MHINYIRFNRQTSEVQQSFKFKPGLNGIFGGNSTGKSSIIGAIKSAYTLSTVPSEVSCPFAYVQMELENNQERYTTTYNLRVNQASVPEYHVDMNSVNNFILIYDYSRFMVYEYAKDIIKNRSSMAHRNIDSIYNDMKKRITNSIILIDDLSVGLDRMKTLELLNELRKLCNQGNQVIYTDVNEMYVTSANIDHIIRI